MKGKRKMWIKPNLVSALIRNVLMRENDQKKEEQKMKSMTNKNLYKSLPVIFAGAILMLVAQGVLAGQTFTVTNTNDSGTGSLRQAILEANANPGLDIIAFNISGRSKGPYTIQPTSPLPQITDPVIIDGYTQPVASLNTNGPGLGSNAVLKIELDGSMAGVNFVHGLHIIAGSSTVRGMAINRFSGNGVAIFGNEATGNLVQGNFIGTDVTGTVDLGNSTDGVQIRGAANNTIGGITAEARNVISGNNVRGISIQGDVNMGGSDATGNLVQGNLIGTDVTGTAALGNTHDGVVIRGAANNTIGGTTAGARNIVSGNNTGGGRGGVSIINHQTLLITGASGNLVQGNFIGTDVTGTAALGNGSGGVIIETAANNTLTDNTISNNVYGVQLQYSSDNQIYNNNFIDNTVQAYVTGSDGNIFNLEKPIGGNYWSDRTSLDADGDGFVDSPYIFTGGVDYLPWARQDGWLPTPKVYYVNAVNGDDNYNGLTLQTAFATIRRGIDSAANGDTVIVSPARYTGAGNRDLDFRGKAITVRSIDPNDQNVVETTIIDCQGRREEPHRGFYFHSGETLSSVIDGFTIKNGYGPLATWSSGTWSVGGGIYCTNSSPTITNNIIAGNTAEYGGGIQCWEYSSPRVINNIIARNSSSQGAGIYCYKYCSARISNNTITENVAGTGGGGIKIDLASSAEIVNNVIAENSAQWKGGGIYCGNSSPVIINNTLAANSSQHEGGGIYIWGNASPLIVNTILWGDSPEEIVLGGGSSFIITYSCVQGGWPGAGNINADPLFLDAANADYRLQDGSPCINAGDNSALPQSLVEDIDGNPRITDGIMDMGAYECGIAAPPPPPPPPPTLSEALDTDLSFTTSGNADWFSQTTTSQYGGDAAQSGDISNNQESWIQTTVNGAPCRNRSAVR
jgi:parallel beta-helix repeat protein